MKISTIMFTYNRPMHVRKLLDALSGNTVLPEKLYIFQDGIKESALHEEWDEVNKCIHNVTFCEKEVIVAQENRGLADSIVSGINYVFENSDAVIVLEDDCIPHPQFIEFMVDSLVKYELNRQVYSVNGYSRPANVLKNGTDAYFSGRTSSWGWATWKNRWAEYRRDYKLLSEIKRDKYAWGQFQIWGRDLEGYLYGNVEGKCNSWAVFWGLLVLKKHGLCVTPYESLIENIGFDGTGVHCGTTKPYTILRDKNNIRKLVLPDIIEFPANYADAYQDIFPWTSPEVKVSIYFNVLLAWMKANRAGKSVAEYLMERQITNVSIWGKGNLTELLLEELDGLVRVSAIIESNPQTDYFFNIPIVQVQMIPAEVQLIIVIPVYDFGMIDRKIKKVHRDVDVIGIDKLLKAL